VLHQHGQSVAALAADGGAVVGVGFAAAVDVAVACATWPFELVVH